MRQTCSKPALTGHEPHGRFDARVARLEFLKDGQLTPWVQLDFGRLGFGPF